MRPERLGPVVGQTRCDMNRTREVKVVKTEFDPDVKSKEISEFIR